MTVKFKTYSSITAAVHPWDEGPDDPFGSQTIQISSDTDTNCLVYIAQIVNPNVVNEINYVRTEYPTTIGPYTYQYFDKAWSGYTYNVGTSQINLQEIWTLTSSTLIPSGNYRIEVYLTGLEADGELRISQHTSQYAQVQSIGSYAGSSASIIIVPSNISDLVVNMTSTLHDEGTLTWLSFVGSEIIDTPFATRTTQGWAHVGGGDGALTIPWETDDEIAYNIGVNLVGVLTGSEIVCGSCIRDEPYSNDINRGWQQILLNVDGTVIGLFENEENKFYTSIDSGINWTLLENVYNYYKTISMSSDGLKILVPSWGVGAYYSTDGGNSYNEITTPISGLDYYNSSISGNGNIIVICSSTEQHKSTDGGANWNRIYALAGSTTPRLKMDLTGTHMIAVDIGYTVSYSDDAGSSWTDLSAFFDDPYDCSISSTGNILIVSDADGINISTDGGSSWNNYEIGILTTRIAMDDDGKTILVDDLSADLESISYDYGITWEQILGPQGYSEVFANSANSGITNLFGTLSGDGNYYGVCYDVGHAYICQIGEAGLGKIKSIAGIVFASIAKVAGVPIANLKKISGEEN